MSATARAVRIGEVAFGNDLPVAVIAGPCVVESEALCLEIAGRMQEATRALGLGYVFKASFDKANRTSGRSARGPGLEAGLAVLAKVRSQLGVPVITDVHEDTPVHEVASVVDALQTPAFLCRQTDYLERVARAGKPVNVKKGQFLAPWDMQHVAQKLVDAGNTQLLLCERGTSFGYNTLINDMRGLPVMRSTGFPVVFDATHSVQQPGGLGAVSGGQARYVPTLARAATAVGVAGLFFETHPRPSEATSDGPNMWPLGRMPELLAVLAELDRVAKKAPFAEDVDAP